MTQTGTHSRIFRYFLVSCIFAIFSFCNSNVELNLTCLFRLKIGVTESVKQSQ